MVEKEEDLFLKMVRQGYELNAILRRRKYENLNDSELNDVNDRLDRFFREYNSVRPVQLIGEG